MFAELILSNIGIKPIGDVLLAHHTYIILTHNCMNVLYAQQINSGTNKHFNAFHVNQLKYTIR